MKRLICFLAVLVMAIQGFAQTKTVVADTVNAKAAVKAQNLQLQRTNNSTGTAIINVTINPTTLDLPNSANNTLKWVVNNCGSSFVIDPFSTQTIGGASTMTLANGDALSLVYNSTTTDWMVIGSDIAINDVLSVDGSGSGLDADLLDGISSTAFGLVANPLSQFAATTSAQLAGVISDETGSGALVFSTSPTLTTPALGTPSALVLTNATGLPLTTGVTGTLPLANLPFGTANQLLRTNAGGTAAEWFTASYLSGTVGIANGGTNITTYTTGDLLYASATNTLSKLADVATGNALISGGVGVAPSWGKIALTTHVSGTLPVANGGTGVTSSSTVASVYSFQAKSLYGQKLTTDDTLGYFPILATTMSSMQLPPATTGNWLSGITVRGSNSLWRGWQMLGSTTDVTINKWYLREGSPSVWGTAYEVATSSWLSRGSVANQTLMWNGSAWTATSSLSNDGTNTSISGQLRLADGSAAAPSFAFTNELGTGLRRPSAGVLAVSLTGAEYARFTTTGLQLGTAGATQGGLFLAGATSGLITVKGAAAAGTWTLTLPTTSGSSGQGLQTNGSGVTTWATFLTAEVDGSTSNELQNVSYTASTRALAISSGTGFTFPLLTSTEAGLAPGSGGGTTNYLRADGTWAAPQGAFTGGGTSGQIAYWSSTINLTSHSLFLYNGSNFSVGTIDNGYKGNFGGTSHAFIAAITSGAAFNAGVVFENSGDANNSWMQYRDGDGTFVQAHSTSQPFASETRTYEALAEKWSFKTNVVNHENISATTASGLTAVNGDIIYVNTTNGTFTSVGFWGRENGVWVKL